jgi:phospholipid/cholesterol/gamma-HCH transport system substrate-binding protein
MATARKTPRHRRDPTRRFNVLGVLTIAVVAIVGYIGYTANSGLPLQDRTEFFVDVPNADRLIDSADVRIGGIRVGQVLDVKAISTAAGRPYARARVALDPSVKRLPADSTAQVRPASVLGLTYVDLRLGHGAASIAEGGTLPLARAKPSSDLTDLFDVFDRSAARQFRRGLRDVSGGFAGRGTALNATIRSVSRLLPKLTGVATVLSAPGTQLPAFLRGYEATVAALEPVSAELAGVFSGGARTFEALAQERDALGATLDAAPGAESAVTRAFTAARPGLDGLARLAVDLRPAAAGLPSTLRRMNATLSAGAPPLRALPSLEPPLTGALEDVGRLTRDGNTSGALRKLTDLAHATRGALSLLAPAQIHCNVITLFMQGFAGTFGTLGTGDGPALGALFLGETGAIGEPLQNAKPSPNLGSNPIPIENETECEAGNEPWTEKQQLGNPPGLQSKTTRDTVPPPGVTQRAQDAGLMTDPEGIAP